MPELRLLTDLVVAIAAAFIGGTIAQRVGLPVIVGYLLAGVALGPFTPGLTVAQGSVPVLAEIGVALLMFALGAEFSQAELRGMGRVAVVGGAVQLLGTMALGPLLAPLLHVPLTAGVFLGALLALSSTVVALKLLMERGELQDLHGRVAVGILVAQDLAVVPMVVLLPALLSGRGAPAVSLALTVGEAAVLLLVTYRPGYRPAWIDRSYVTQVALQPLTSQDSSRIVQAVLPAVAPSAPLVPQAAGYIKDLTGSLDSAFYLSGGLLLAAVLLSRLLRRPLLAGE